jgi:hypothetical protein
VVGIATGTSPTDLSIDVSGGVTGVLPLVREGNGRVGIYYVTTSGAGGITVRNNSTSPNSTRRILVGEAVNLTSTGAIVATGAGGQTNAQTATLMAVPEGHVVIAMIAYVQSNTAANNVLTWGGGFASSDEVDDTRITSHSFGAASKVAASTGDFVISCSITGDDGVWNWRLAAVALAGA